MKILDGLELAGYIKERQAHQVRALRQAHKIFPKLAIVRTIDDPRIAAYVRLKKSYGADILIDVEEHFVPQNQAPDLIKKLNADASVTAIIIQLPLSDPAQTEELVNAVDPKKDVDGLGANTILQPATALSIVWLLNGYNVELNGKKIVIVGQGRLVGAPLEKLLLQANLNVQVVTKSTKNIEAVIRDADVLISAAGAPGVIKPDMIKIGAVVVDAGVATDKGKLVGDIDPAVRERNDLTITPEKGGVGPLTVCALFDNVIRAAQL